MEPAIMIKQSVNEQELPLDGWKPDPCADHELTEDELIMPYPPVSLLSSTHIVGEKNSLVGHKLTLLRDKHTSSSDFRTIIGEVTTIIGVEALSHLETQPVTIETPICRTVGRVIAGLKQVIVPIMRAGMGMEPAMKALLPKARTGHIGLYRDEQTLEPKAYFIKMPKNIEERMALILDPMLATGGSADAAIKMLKERGCQKINFLCVVAAPRGVDLLQTDHPDVELWIGALDKGLNKNGYIVPGLGDAGDRIFGTK